MEQTPMSTFVYLTVPTGIGGEMFTEDRVIAETFSSGLCIHRSADPMELFSSPPWVVAHTITGRRILATKTLEAAQQRREELEAIADWHFKDWTAPQSWPTETCDRIRAIVE